MVGKVMIGKEAARLCFGTEMPETVIINERREIAGATGLMLNDAWIHLPMGPKTGRVLRVYEEGGKILIDESQEHANG